MTTGLSAICYLHLLQGRPRDICYKADLTQDTSELSAICYLHLLQGRPRDHARHIREALTARVYMNSSCETHTLLITTMVTWTLSKMTNIGTAGNADVTCGLHIPPSAFTFKARESSHHKRTTELAQPAKEISTNS